MRKTVLIADESATTRNFISSSLGQAGCLVIEGVDAKGGLAKLRGQVAHLIIANVDLPGEEGISFVQAVRCLPEHKFTPIVMLSDGLVKTSREQALEPDIKAWLTTPLVVDRLLDVVSRFALT